MRREAHIMVNTEYAPLGASVGAQKKLEEVVTSAALVTCSPSKLLCISIVHPT